MDYAVQLSDLSSSQTLCPISRLHKTNSKGVTTNSGVYGVFVPAGFQVIINDNLPAEHPHRGLFDLFDAAELQEKFISGDGQTLYIGKSDNLRSRLRQLVALCYGTGNAHRGGRAMWQLRDSKSLNVAWLECDDPTK